ncbi:site-specific integrase [Sporosarcina quadrami]
MIALKRKDFDFEKNLMTISKARGYSSNMGDGEQETKSIASERVIEINKKQ